MFLAMFFHGHDMLMFEPYGHSKGRWQIVVQHVIRYGQCCGRAIELKHFVGLATFIARQGFRPFAAHAWRRQEVDALLASS